MIPTLFFIPHSNSFGIQHVGAMMQFADSATPGTYDTHNQTIKLVFNMIYIDSLSKKTKKIFLEQELMVRNIVISELSFARNACSAKRFTLVLAPIKITTTF